MANPPRPLALERVDAPPDYNSTVHYKTTEAVASLPSMGSTPAIGARLENFLERKTNYKTQLKRTNAADGPYRISGTVYKTNVILTICTHTGIRI